MSNNSRPESNGQVLHLGQKQALQVMGAARRACACEDSTCSTCHRDLGQERVGVPYHTHCPAHDDANPSLGFKVEGGQLFIRCFAGCSKESVAQALREKGVMWTEHGLTVQELAEAKKLPAEWLRKEWGLEEKRYQGKYRVVIPYLGLDPTPVRYRLALEGDRFSWRNRDKAGLYGVHLLDKIRQLGYVVLVEGESDTWTLWHYERPALGVPGQFAWKPEWAKYLEGIPNIYIWQEPDAAGFVKRIAVDLPQAKVLLPPPGIKDISDAHVAGQDVPRLLEDLMRQAQPAPQPGPGELILRAEDRDYGHAQVLAPLICDRYRWAAHRGWMQWTGKVWEEVGEEVVIKEAMERLRNFYKAERVKVDPGDESAKEIIDQKIQEASTYQTVRSVVQLLKADPAIATKPDAWDRHPWLVNVANGVVDLQTNRLQEHCPHWLLTHYAPVTYDPAADCPKFKQHLELCLPSAHVRRQVQRDIGRALYGGTLEESLAIWYGTGANGKTTTCRVLHEVLGSYAGWAAPNLFVQSKHEQHPTGKADLVGKRLVFLEEMNVGCRLDTALVKELTGGGMIKARFCYKDFFEFPRTFSFILATNHKPRIPETDKGTWRRIRLIPWTQEIPAEKRRPQDEVVRELVQEASGILNWALAGWADYMQDRAWVAAEVQQASEDYRLQNDEFGEFLQECCELGDGYQVKKRELYQAYCNWYTSNGLGKPPSHKMVSSWLKERGISEARLGHDKAHYYLGIRVIKDQQSDTDKPSVVRPTADVHTQQQVMTLLQQPARSALREP
jgi:putative DNA primase/helicase